MNSSIILNETLPSKSLTKKCVLSNYARVLALLGVDDPSISENSNLDPNNPNGWTYLAISHFSQQDWQKSVAALEKALTLADPTRQRDLLLLLCKLFFNLNKPAEARKYAEIW